MTTPEEVLRNLSTDEIKDNLKYEFSAALDELIASIASGDMEGVPEEAMDIRVIVAPMTVAILRERLRG